ncbi:hypothetical protein VCR15J2_390078 [Vibrio coralliirubri]|uniref:hypothetical protein n=1 Tax=Vibrio coralliirubri TaxID=1516159 RepID=UPI00063891BD|nr:hypothetical protein [Vibrio coralliirubri]CDT53483.1 hypothetical protein VCR15J2_390078 [Vibrio coralliirubri]
MLKRFIDANEMCNMTIKEVADEMAELNAGSMTLSFRGEGDKALAAVILVSGDDTQEYLDALDKVTEEEE